MREQEEEDLKDLYSQYNQCQIWYFTFEVGGNFTSHFLHLLPKNRNKGLLSGKGIKKSTPRALEALIYMVSRGAIQIRTGE